MDKLTLPFAEAQLVTGEGLGVAVGAVLAAILAVADAEQPPVPDTVTL